MTRVALGILAAYFGVTALYLWFLPHDFYTRTPGVSLTGGYNVHFIRDIAMAFGVSAGLIAWGLRKTIRELPFAGSLWVSAHGLFHIYIQVRRGLPLDTIFFSDLFGVIVPAGLALWLSWKFMEDNS